MGITTSFKMRPTSFHNSASDANITIDFDNDGDEYLSSDEIQDRETRIAGYLKTQRHIPKHFIALLFVFISLTLICIGLCIEALFGHPLEMGDKEIHEDAIMIHVAVICYLIGFIIAFISVPTLTLIYMSNPNINEAIPWTFIIFLTMDCLFFILISVLSGIG